MSSLVDLGADNWSKANANAVMIAAGGLSGGLGSVIGGGDFWSGVRNGLIVAGLNHAMHRIGNPLENQQTTGTGDYSDIEYDLEGLKKYLAIVAGESSNNWEEAASIGSVILNRLKHVGADMTGDFVAKIGGSGEFDAIGGIIYNEVMASSWDDLTSPDNAYALRIDGAASALTQNYDYSLGAYFWNASSPKVGFNWRAYNRGAYSITATHGKSTFFHYSEGQNRVWP